MKRFLYSLGLLCLLISCTSETENTMTINGTIKGLKKGTLYLQHINDTTLVTVDSLEIEGDGKFTFKTELESPEIFYLYLDKKDNNDINDRISFFAEPGLINVSTHWNSFDTKAKITGSKSQEKLEEFRKVMSDNNLRSLELTQLISNQNATYSAEELDSIALLYNRKIQRSYVFAINFAINNKDSYIAPYIAVKEIPEVNVKYLDSIASVLPTEVANSKYGKELSLLIEKSKE
ncbi:DUF4369 domain-containing protein [Maribacter chungangensis]|uniref:DUF4369 domain-containing protein n=1 Tax=Maribacter chungangensis TaxID=1069117 RepID=A0ABW3B6A1_9FLAO